MVKKMEPDSSDHKPLRQVLDSAAILAALTAMSYLSAYFWVDGYFRYFGVTKPPVHMDTQAMLLPAAAIIVALCSIYPIWLLTPSNTLRLLLNSLSISYPTIIIAFLLMVAYAYLGVTVITVTLVILLILSPLFIAIKFFTTRLQDENYSSWMERHLQTEYEEGTTELGRKTRIIAESKYSLPFLLGAGIICLPLIVFNIAIVYAGSRNSFLKMELEGSSYILLHGSNEKIIFAEGKINKETPQEFKLNG